MINDDALFNSRYIHNAVDPLYLKIVQHNGRKYVSLKKQVPSTVMHLDYVIRIYC